MPSSETAKTRSALRRRFGWGLLGVALVAMALAGAWQAQAQHVKVRLGNRLYTLTRAVTKTQQEKGLGGTPSLAPDRGMLFLGKRQGDECFWMKDMKYPLDIIWLDDHKKVVHIARDVAPSSYPHIFCSPGQYVIEINAGEVAKNGLRAGQAVTF